MATRVSPYTQELATLGAATTLTSTHTLAGAPTRSRVNLGKASRGFSFRVTPAFSASATSTTGFHLDAIEAEVTPLYGRRR